jgi:hypothetical protein
MKRRRIIRRRDLVKAPRLGGWHVSQAFAARRDGLGLDRQKPLGAPAKAPAGAAGGRGIRAREGKRAQMIRPMGGSAGGQKLGSDRKTRRSGQTGKRAGGSARSVAGGLTPSAGASGGAAIRGSRRPNDNRWRFRRRSRARARSRLVGSCHNGADMTSRKSLRVRPMSASMRSSNAASAAASLRFLWALMSSRARATTIRASLMPGI